MTKAPHISVCFGTGRIDLPIEETGVQIDVFHPRSLSPIVDARRAFHSHCREPLGSAPLNEIVKPDDRVVIVTADGTRPVPNHLLIPWLIEALPVPPENITVLLGNGAHRANTPGELRAMFGDEIADMVHIVNHDAFSHSDLKLVGHAPEGSPVYLNRIYLEADKRVIVGLIEPHFFAGFSGGAKAVVPGIGGIETILAAHRAELIADPHSTWGTLATNPIRNLIDEMVHFASPDFMIDVALDEGQNIASFFAGDYRIAHVEGCAFVKEHSLIETPHAYPLVIASNCGYPLDQNIYQAVKGISAAVNIVEPGGTILLCAACADGFASHDKFGEIMRIGNSPDDVLQWILAQRETQIDQWQAQILAQILKKANVHLYSTMSPAEVAAVKMHPVVDIDEFLAEHIASLKPGQRIAVLPEGFQAVPIHKAD